MTLRKTAVGVACLLAWCVPVSAEIGQVASVTIVIDASCDHVWQVSGNGLAWLSITNGGGTTYVPKGTGSGRGDKVGDQVAIDYVYGNHSFLITEKNNSSYKLGLVLVSGFNTLFQASRDQIEMTSLGSAVCRVDRTMRASTSEFVDLAGVANQGLENLKAFTESH